MAVIERTPSRAEVRFGENGCIFVTNDYRAMQTELRDFKSELQGTACGRYDRVAALVAARIPQDSETCLNYLSDSAVRMRITVQQMVFQASSGLCRVR